MLWVDYKLTSNAHNFATNYEYTEFGGTVIRLQISIFMFFVFSQYIVLKKNTAASSCTTRYSLVSDKKCCSQLYSNVMTVLQNSFKICPFRLKRNKANQSIKFKSSQDFQRLIRCDTSTCILFQAPKHEQ